MRIKRSHLERLVREELGRALAGLSEKGPPAVQDAEDDNGRKEKSPPKPGDVPPAVQGKGPGRPPEDKVPQPPEKRGPGRPPKDDTARPAKPPVEPEKDLAAKVDDDGDDSTTDDTGQARSKVADQLGGKRIQSVTVEPKSKVLPGATEVVFTFADVPDPFKILIGKTGKLSFWWKGLHNEL